MASKIQNNNTSLEEILATINALPNAGSGSSGSGGSMETCTVEITLNAIVESTQYPFQYAYSCVSDGVITSGTQSGIQPRVIIDSGSWKKTLSNVLCGSIIVLSIYNYSGLESSLALSGLTLLGSHSYTYWFMVTAANGGTASIIK